MLTGGGSQLDGLLEMAEQIFDSSVRYGLPAGLTGLVDVISSPAWATASGHAALRHGRPRTARGRAKRRGGWSLKNAVGNIREMFSDLL